MKSTKGVAMSDLPAMPLKSAAEFIASIENDPELKAGLLAGDNAAFEKYFGLAGTPAVVTSTQE